MTNTLFQLFLILRPFSENTLLVGGCVRDTLLELTPKDYDIVTDISMDIISKELADEGWKVVDTGLQFLVLTVSKNDETYEIANFRKDGISYDGRRPSTVEIGTIEEDAKRRDFTINAFYQNPFTGEIIAPIKESMSDIQNKTLRFIGKPEDRIKEDYLRIFRFYRFLAEKGLTPDKKSLTACRTYFNEAVEKTAGERIRNEIERMI